MKPQITCERRAKGWRDGGGGGQMRYSLTPVLMTDVPERVLTPPSRRPRCRRVNKENVRAHSSRCGGGGGELVSWQRAR